LPNSYAHTSTFRGRVWSQRDNGIELVTNPLFYKIVEIGARPGLGPKKTRKPVVRGKKGFTSDLLKLEGFDEEAARQAIAEERKRRRIINAKKSAKSKAKRKPPNKKTSKPDDVDVPEESSRKPVTRGKKAFTSDLWKLEGLDEQDDDIDVDEEDIDIDIDEDIDNDEEDVDIDDDEEYEEDEEDVDIDDDDDELDDD
jgi:hypothetical protein